MMESHNPPVAAIVPWILRFGAVLGIASPFLPQASIGERPVSPLRALKTLFPLMAPMDFAVHAAWLLAPAAAAAAVLAGSTRAGRRSAACRVGTTAFCLAAAFGLATQGSILMTRAEGAGAYPLALFVAPLAAAVVLIGRLLGEASPEPTAGFARLSLGVFMALNGLFLHDWWAILAGWTGSPGSERLLAGAWAGPAGGLLIAAAEAAELLRSPGRR
jgi:hypothetical protein